MVKLYYELIKKNLWSIDRVPSPWKEGVQAMLDADNPAPTEEPKETPVEPTVPVEEKPTEEPTTEEPKVEDPTTPNADENKEATTETPATEEPVVEQPTEKPVE